MNNNTVTIRNITLGCGRPKICLPIVGSTLKEIKAQTEAIMQNPVDIIEWRADLFQYTTDPSSTDEAILTIRRIIGDIPLLYTIRTTNEGGGISLSFEEYSTLVKRAAASPHIDAVDVEILMADKATSPSENLQSNQETVTSLITSLKENAAVIASSHDFAKTPDKEEIIRRLQYMETCGADICKMAVMPRSKEDVLILLSATSEAREQLSRPIITMSMGKSGLISRLCGEVFGSALTFGCVGQSSAPGQIDATELDKVLEIIHKNMKI